jgi:purine-binding chemotaxis protein CheW
MEALYLIVQLAGQRVALSADHVESVVEVDAVTPVPLVARHVAGLAALRSRVLTIIDSLAALELGTTPLDGTKQAVIVTVDGHLYGLIVDQVEDVASLDQGITQVRVPLSAGWQRTALGMIEIDGDALLLLDPAALVAGPPALAA